MPEYRQTSRPPQDPAAVAEAALSDLLADTRSGRPLSIGDALRLSDLADTLLGEVEHRGGGWALMN